MDIDGVNDSLCQPFDISIMVHPLAIVNMSDQYTRITCGGTPLSSTTPVVGLLFGTYHKVQEETSKTSSTSSHVQVNIMDADEIPVTKSDIATTQISLHQAVFEKHVVVGWYSVITKQYNDNIDMHDNDGPTYDDLRITKNLKELYQGSATSGSPNPFIFALLQVEDQQQQEQQQKPKAQKTPAVSSSTSDAVGSDKYDDDEVENEDVLPLTLYQLSSDHQVLIAIDDEWKLDTSPPEKVAVECVMNEQQKPKHEKSFYYSSEQPTSASSSTSLPSTTMIKIPSSVIQSNKFIHETMPIKQSIDAMQKRMKIVFQFVSDTMSQTIPYNPTLLRHVYCIILQNHLLSSSLSSSSTSVSEQNDTKLQSTVVASRISPPISSAAINRSNGDDTYELLQHLSVLAKTVDAIQTYTDKVKLIISTTSSSGVTGSGSGITSSLATLIGGGAKLRSAATSSSSMMNARE